MANELIKPIKKALVKKYGYKNVSVKNGTGTAWGWVYINLILNRPENCACAENEPYCQTCRTYGNEKSAEAEKIALEALKKENLKPYTYCGDDGYNTDRNEIIVQVDLINPAENRPEYGKQYALTGKSGDKCISNGNTWAESAVN